ncbi:MAG: RNA polymerase sigma factor [Terriglobia bacterium]
MIQDETSEALFAQRDAEALGELYARFAPALLGMLQRILPDRDAAEDALDRVFLQAWKEADPPAGGRASVAARLFLTARAIAVRLRRKQLKLPALPASPGDRIDSNLSRLPNAEAVKRVDERRELLKKSLSQLPKAQRELLELAVFEGLTEEEIAAKLGEPLGKVKSGLRAGMRFIRHRLRAVTGTWAANI